MDRIILTITSELFDDNMRQEASVRVNVTVRALIEEIRREFSLLDGSYSLTPGGDGGALPLDQTLGHLGIQTGAELVFERERRGLSQQMVMRGGQFFRALTTARQPVLRARATGQRFEISWQPAIIGRPDANNPASAELLAVDLSKMEDARTVSRQHAQIIEQRGQYFLEAIAERNLTFLNDNELAAGERRGLTSGDEIRVGTIVLEYDTCPV